MRSFSYKYNNSCSRDLTVNNLKGHTRWRLLNNYGDSSTCCISHSLCQLVIYRNLIIFFWHLSNYVFLRWHRTNHFFHHYCRCALKFPYYVMSLRPGTLLCPIDQSIVRRCSNIYGLTLTGLQLDHNLSIKIIDL